VFAPVAAQLALETPIEEVGEPVPPEDLVRIDLPAARIASDQVIARVIYVDRFGNVQLNVHRDHLAKAGFEIGKPVRVQVGPKSRRAMYAHTFADVSAGEALVYEDSGKAIAIAVNEGDAAAELAIDFDSEVKLRLWPPRPKPIAKG
jgi:S-adenosylmethionine hydrolase